MKKGVIKSVLAIATSVAITATLVSPASVYARYREGATNRNVHNAVSGDSAHYYQSPVTVRFDGDGKYDNTVNYYNYPIYNDPDDVLTDAEFFGVFENGEWTTEPLLNYAGFEGLSAVETAAKSGNYETAEQALLEYYRAIGTSRINATSAKNYHNAERYMAFRDSMARNIFPCGFISGDQIGFFNARYNASESPENWSVSTFDISRTLSSSLAGCSQFNIMVSSVDKFYTSAYIASKEYAGGAYKPTLTVVTDKGTFSCPVVKDAMIVGGTDADSTHGSESIMTVQEHGTFQNYDDGGVENAKTRRVFISFDIKSIPKNAKINKATVSLTCRSGDPSTAGKELSAYWYKDYKWNESTVCWNSFSDQLWFSCNDMEAWDYVTSSEASVKGKVCGYHRDVEPALLYNAYQSSKNAGAKDETYAYQYIRHIMAMINGLDFSYVKNLRPIKEGSMNSLDMSTHVTSLTDGIFYCIDSQYMSADSLTAMIKHCYLLSRWQVKKYFGTADNNVMSFATGSVYAFISKFKEISVHDEWMESLKAEYARMMGKASLDDGMCLELPMHYIEVLLSTYSTPFVVAESSGAELPYGPQQLKSIRDTVMTLVYSKGPYHGFNQHDTYDAYDSIKSIYTKWYNYGLKYNIFEAEDLENLKYLSTDGVNGSMPEYPTIHYPVGKKTFMRSGWNKNDTMLSFINNYSNEVSHRHKDVLSLALFAHGKYLLTDQGYGSLLTGGMCSYMLSPAQHNLVTVNDTEDWLSYNDESRQSTSNGTLRGDYGGFVGNDREVAFAGNTQYDFTEYSTDRYRTAQLAQRSVLYVRDADFYIVTDYDVPTDTSAENTFAQHWHMYPGSNFTVDGTTKTVTSRFANEPNIKIVPAEYDEIDRVERVNTKYSETEGSFEDSQKAMIVKNHTGSGRFTTLLMPMKANENIAVAAEKLSTNYADRNLVNAAKFTVENPSNGKTDEYTYFHINDANRKEASSRIGEFTTDATTMLVKKDSNGKIVSVFMMGGSYVKSSSLVNGYLIKTENPIDSVSYTVEGTKMKLAMSDMTQDELNGMIIYSGGTNSVEITNAQWNDPTCRVESSDVPCSIEAGYIYFSDVMPVDDLDTETVVSFINPMNYNSFSDAAADGWQKNKEAHSTIVVDNQKVKMLQTTSENQSFTEQMTYNFPMGKVVEDHSNGTAILTNKYKGKLRLDVTYNANAVTNSAQGYSAPYYLLDIAGNKSAITGRIYEKSTTSFNGTNYATSDSSLITNIVSDNYSTTDNTISYIFDTSAQTVTVKNDALGISLTGDTLPKNMGTGTLDYISRIMVSGVGRAAVGSYFTVKSLKLTSAPSFTETETAFFGTLPQNLDSLFAANGESRNGVTKSFTLPQVEGVTWRGDNTYTFVSGNEVSLTFPEASDDTARVYADFSIGGINYSKEYTFTVAQAYTVRFYDKNNELYRTVLSHRGAAVAAEDAPEYEGLVFDGWYEQGAENTFDFAEPLNKSTDLYPRYVNGILSFSADTNSLQGWSAIKGTYIDAVSDNGTVAMVHKNSDSSKRVTTDGIKYTFPKGIVEQNQANRTTLYADGKYKGKMKVDITYTLDLNYDPSITKPFAHLTLSGNENAVMDRLYNDSVIFLNTTSTSTGKIGTKALNYNDGGTYHTTSFEVDTESETVGCALNGGASSAGDTFAKKSGKELKYLSNLKINSMQCIENGSFVKIKDLRLVMLEPSFTEEETAILSQLPENLVTADGEDVRNVQSNITLPEIDGVVWSSSDSSVIEINGSVAIVKGYTYNPCDVVISAGFTVNGIAYTKEYTLTVTKEDTTVYTVNFYCGNTLCESTEVVRGRTVSAPELPQREYYTLNGWCKAGTDEIFDFSDGILENTDFYANYTANMTQIVGKDLTAIENISELNGLTVNSNSDYITVSADGGIRVNQINCLPYKNLSTQNTTQESLFGITFDSEIQRDDDARTVVKEKNFSGKYQLDLTLDYDVKDFDYSSVSGYTGTKNLGYYYLSIGKAETENSLNAATVPMYVRLTPSKFTVSNTASAANSTLVPSVPKLSGLAKGESNTLHIIVDTNAHTSTIWADDTVIESFSGTFMNNSDYINAFSFKGMQRMLESSYLRLSGFKLFEIEKNTSGDGYDVCQQALNALPVTLSEDPYSVTENITLPQIENVIWSTSDENTISTDGAVTRNSVDTDVTVTATVSCGNYKYVKEYLLSVPCSE